jgi:hypothetical protein
MKRVNNDTIDTIDTIGTTNAASPAGVVNPLPETPEARAVRLLREADVYLYNVALSMRELDLPAFAPFTRNCTGLGSVMLMYRRNVAPGVTIATILLVGGLTRITVNGGVLTVYPYLEVRHDRTHPIEQVGANLRYRHLQADFLGGVRRRFDVFYLNQELWDRCVTVTECSKVLL